MSPGHGPDQVCRIRACRDCCCGSARKHPEVDHDQLLERLEAGVGSAGLVSVGACLLACERSDVVVVSPSVAGRRSGGRPVWLGEVLDVETVDAIAGWVRQGGPGMAGLPETLGIREAPRPALATALLDETMIR